jgi:hypothetical protein
MTDKEFLSWVADRLVHVYGESQSVDFVHKLRKISQRTWVGLTLDERIELAQDVDWAAGAYCEYAENIESKLKEKNEFC